MKKIPGMETKFDARVESRDQERSSQKSNRITSHKAVSMEDLFTPSSTNTYSFSESSPVTLGSPEDHPSTTAQEFPRKRPRKKPTPHSAAMEALCFENIFDTITTDQLATLEQEYMYFAEKLPSRKEIKAISEKIGLSQSRIRRWFLNKYEENRTIIIAAPDVNTSQSSLKSTGTEEDMADRLSVAGVSSSVLTCCEDRIARFERRLDGLELEIRQLKSQMHGEAGNPFLGIL